MPDLLTLSEVSAALRVSRATVTRLIASQQLPIVKVGRRTFVTRQALEAFVDNLEQHERLMALRAFQRLGEPSTLYDTDFYAWTQTQAKALRCEDWAALDVEHLAEEIESMGKRDRRAVESYLEVRLRHGLKWVYQSERRSGSWRRTLVVTRQRLARVLRDHHTLRAQLPELITAAYADARELAAAETRLPLATFPQACPWTVEQVLHGDFGAEDRP